MFLSSKFNPRKGVFCWKNLPYSIEIVLDTCQKYFREGSIVREKDWIISLWLIIKSTRWWKSGTGYSAYWTCMHFDYKNDKDWTITWAEAGSTITTNHNHLSDQNFRGNCSNKSLGFFFQITSKPLTHGYRYHKFWTTFGKFFGSYSEL